MVLVRQAALVALVALVAQAVHQAVHQAAQVIVAEVTNGLRQSSKRWQC